MWACSAEPILRKSYFNLRILGAADCSHATAASEMWNFWFISLRASDQATLHALQEDFLG